VNAAERFAQNLRRHRKAAGLSQEEFAIRASLHRTAVSRMEQGKTNPQLDTLVRLAGAAECTVADLAEGITWLPAEQHKGRFSIPDGR
jgi:transcriptional regulator with XRE-family HTH domain